MQRSKNEFANRRPPTKSSYRSAVAKIIRQVQSEHDLTDDEMAETIGCSGPTVANARNEAVSLKGETLARIQYHFGVDAIDDFLALSGARATQNRVGGQRDGKDPAILFNEVLRVLLEARHADDAELIAALPTLNDARIALDGLILSANSAGRSPLRSVS